MHVKTCTNELLNILIHKLLMPKKWPDRLVRLQLERGDMVLPHLDLYNNKRELRKSDKTTSIINTSWRKSIFCNWISVPPWESGDSGGTYQFSMKLALNKYPNCKVTMRCSRGDPLSRSRRNLFTSKKDPISESKLNTNEAKWTTAWWIQSPD